MQYELTHTLDLESFPVHCIDCQMLKLEPSNLAIAQ